MDPNFIDEGYFHKEIFLLKLGGISLSGNESVLYKIYSFVVIISLNYVYSFMQLLGVLLYPDEVDSNTIYCLCSFYLALVKITVVLLRRKQLGEILKKLGQKPFAVNLERGGENEQNLMKECLKICSVQKLVYFASFLCNIFVYIVYTVTKRIKSNDPDDWILPYGKLPLFDVSVSPNYELAWFYQMLSVICLAINFVMIDLLVVFILCHIRYQFKILQNSLRLIAKPISCIKMTKNTNLGLDLLSNRKPDKLDASAVPWECLQKSLRKTVSYHLAILNIAAEVENAFNVLFLFLLFFTIAIVCFIVLRLSMLSISDPEIIPGVFSAMILYIQTIMFCFWGEQISNESEEVANAAFEANFVGTDIRYQKGLILIIGRSRTLTKVTAAKFTDIRLATFVWIMRATYSSFMLLRNVQGKPNA